MALIIESPLTGVRTQEIENRIGNYLKWEVESRTEDKLIEDIGIFTKNIQNYWKLCGIVCEKEVSSDTGDSGND